MVMGVTLGVSISASALRVGSGCTVALPSALRVGGNAQSTHQRDPGEEPGPAPSGSPPMRLRWRPDRENGAGVAFARSEENAAARRPGS